MEQRTHRMRRNGDSYTLAIPREIGRALFDRRMKYTTELTDEGILHRPYVQQSEPDKQIDLPSWAKP